MHEIKNPDILDSGNDSKQANIMAQIKQISIRWPEDFWETVTVEAVKRRTSVQALVTVAVAQYLGIEPPDGEEE